ncbi:MAG: glycoside hydrolase [Phycisphaerales bacterium]|nr:glycoside hydrolase [Phycisphaerales bacterium]
MLALLLPVLLLLPTAPPLPGRPMAIPVLAEQIPAGPGAMAPSVCQANSTAPIHMVWLEPAPPAPERDEHWRVRYSRRDHDGWTEPVTVTERPDLFVNWADVPAIAVSDNGTIVVSWLQKSGPGTYAYDAMVARSTDSGSTWTPLGPLHDDGTKTEHGFVSLVPEGDDVRAFWLDGRAMTGDGHGHGGGDMTIRTAIVDEQIRDGAMLDPRVCECCNTAAVRTSQGPLVTYRDRSDEEVRDISMVRLGDPAAGRPTIVHADEWAIAGCPVNGPAMDAIDDTTALSWYTGAGEGGVNIAFGSASGTFASPISIAGEAALGRVDIILRNNKEAVVSWIETSGNHTVLRARVITRDGQAGPPLTVTTVPTGRSSGFPRLAQRGDLLMALWTSTDRDKGLQAVLIPPAALPGLVQ